ncbi:Putative zinc-or iron-chelating domain-containing protein [Thermanaeromonas toyohensis ToBE]|uniref:Putative zinc-or iron-chelating domain-containing protein n=1 Tax=Thermanaeromonas toyohensis ToBE TaxID=698762 RepID=A0A1W1VXT9_9FIRM|nr:Putative zinc-or iron-chelating domain-containing protein [Thermanaeromonas toyohensis ToBE]
MAWVKDNNKVMGKMDMEPIVVRPWYVNGKGGYDLAVASPEATVEDYLQALKKVEGFELYRAFRPGGSCYGCPHCCRDRLPLTLADVFLLRQGLKALTGRDMPLREVLSKYCQVRKIGPAWDITLSTDAEGYCIFLTPGSHLCRLYPYRPLVCRTYYCCPATYRSLALRSAIVNRGQDELGFYWERGKLRLPSLYLRDICSPALWKKLTRRKASCVSPLSPMTVRRRS